MAVRRKTMRLVISATEAAKVLCTTPNKVQQMLASGELPAYREGKNWKIPISLLEKYVEDRALAETEKRKGAPQ